MPSGYTYIIEEDPNLTFERFALRCARAFGALVHMRDEDLDSNIPDEIKLNTYHRDRLDELSKKLLDVRALTHQDIEREVETRAWHDKREHERALREYTEKDERYQRMLAKVEAWRPPTPEHKNLKEFMLDQIKQSLPTHPSKYRSATLHDDPKQALVGLDHEAYRKEKVDDVLRDMEYHEKHWKDDLDRARKNNEWVNLLRSSVKGK